MSNTDVIDPKARQHAWRVRLLAGWMARHLDTTTPADASLASRSIRVGKAWEKLRRFTHRMDAPWGSGRYEWGDACWEARQLIKEAFALHDGNPFAVRFPLPTP
jgi:hypothetical protein